MAYETGVASDYVDFWRKLVLFLTQNTDLVAAGDQWEITRGFINGDIEYIHDETFEGSGIAVWDPACAMGWDDSYMAVHEGGNRKIGWVSRLVQAPNWLGFKSSSAVSPTYYTISSEYWIGTTNEADRQAKAWEVQYSDDGVGWTISDTVTDQTGWAYNETRQFLITEATPHKFWRLNFTANNGDVDYVSLGRLRFYDAGNNWVSRGHTTEYMFKLRGFSGNDPAYCGMRLHIDPNAYYNIEWMGSTCYASDLPFESQPNILRSRYSPLWNRDMQYWFVANGHRMICVMHVNERWIAATMGKFLPYGSSGQYPYTMMIGGSANYNISWTQEDSASNIQAPAEDNYSLYVYRPNTGWSALRNRDYNGGLTSSTDVLSPTVSGGMSVGNRQLPNGAYVLAPYIIELADKAYGHVDGMRWLSGDKLVSGDILDVCGQDWLAFHNHQYTGISDFAALELK